jgi:flagellar basal-body rod protein FlgB
MALIDSDALLGLLDAATRNHSVIANNLANLNTPGYRTQRLSFARELERLLDRNGRLRPGAEIQTEIYRPMFRDASPDGNDVLLEREMGQLNKNMMRVRLYLSVLNSRIRRLRSAIEGR